jgi:hypothetical protein
MTVAAGGTGAQRVGGAIVAALEASGHRVVVIDRNAEISVDLSDEESTRSGAAELLDRYGRRRARSRCSSLRLAELGRHRRRDVEACPSRQRRVTAVAVPGVHSWNGAAWVRSDRVHRFGHVLGPTGSDVGALHRQQGRRGRDHVISGACARSGRHLRDCGGSRSYRYGGLSHDRHRCPVRRGR